jgi:feruloyl esterase
VQRYPLDYNGVVAGAPANYPIHMWPGELWPAWYTHKDAAQVIPTTKLSAISAAAVAACDENDGVKDGLIRDPRTCNFDPGTLVPSVLTPEQADSVRAIYGGLKDPTTGVQFWPGYEMGSESDWSGHIGNPFGTPLAYFKYFYHGDSLWNWQTFDMTAPKNMQLMYDADAKLRPVLNSTDADISSFSRAGKLIMYHGWSDQNISPRNSVSYFENVVALQGTIARTQTFMRLFMAPGMGHCGGGVGPNTFDTLTALENWVEKGQAPESIIASHSTGGVVDRTRPLCPYPQVEKYDGSGDINDAANFVCANP